MLGDDVCVVVAVYIPGKCIISGVIDGLHRCTVFEDGKLMGKLPCFVPDGKLMGKLPCFRTVPLGS